MEQEATEYFHQGLYYKALPIYLKLDSMGLPHYKYPIGVCYLNLYNDAKALPYFEQCMKEEDKYPLRLKFYLAKCYHLAHRFDEAISNYTAYRSKLKPKRNGSAITLVDRQIEMCNNGKQLSAKPLQIEIHNLGSKINTQYPEYAAVVSADEDELIFTSNRPNTTGGHIDPNDGRYYEDIYISHKVSGEWSEPQKMNSEINTTGNDASIALSADGQKLILYRFAHDNIVSTSGGNLFYSNLKGNEWTTPVRFPDQINEGGYQPSACLSENEKVMYFVSNRSGGHGGTDLYMVKKLPHGEWALPMNMGNVINTPYDEDSPFLHPDGKTLYFSSTGHNSMGGYDIFVTRFNDSTQAWSKPENIGYPLNTAQDDIHFSWSADARRMYFSTIRPEGHGDKDIYYADIEKEAAEVLVMKGIVFDSLNRKPMEATIKVVDNRTNEVVGIFNSNSATGKYLVILPEGKNYSFTVEAPNHGLCTEMVNIEELHEYKEVNKNITLCPR